MEARNQRVVLCVTFADSREALLQANSAMNDAASLVRGQVHDSPALPNFHILTLSPLMLSPSTVIIRSVGGREGGATLTVPDWIRESGSIIYVLIPLAVD